MGGDDSRLVAAGIQKWARKLGWPKLAAHRKRFSCDHDHHDDADGGGEKHFHLLRWYDVGDFDDLLLHVNQDPMWHAAVYAPRYRLCSEWHELDPLDWESEAERLTDWLHHDLFATPKGRRRFRELHPRCATYSAAKIERESPLWIHPLPRKQTKHKPGKR
jgi:hypothetical protein